MLRSAVALALWAVAASAGDSDELAWPDALPVEGREALLRDGVWVGPRQFRQVFEAYNNPPAPVFVTTDGPIVAAYRLMEWTVMRMERWSMARLPGALRGLEERFAEAAADLGLPAATVAAAERRARLTIAVARLLLGEEPSRLAAGDLDRARACAALIERAVGRSMPDGFGPPVPGWLGFEWRVFEPRGPYVATERRKRAFRALKWLQSVPFRLERDDELAALWLVQRAGDDYWPSPMWADDLLALDLDHTVFSEGFLELDDVDGLGPEGLEALRAALRARLGDRVSTDLLWTTARGDELRLAPTVVLPEVALFFELVQPRLPGAGFPAGLTVAAALGSPPAREALEPERLAAIDRYGALSGGAGWLAHAYRMRAALFDEAEPDAPALFRSRAWQRKALRTALGSWALERNVWTLHSGETVVYGGGPRQLPGLVEPEPEVYSQLALMGRCVLRWMRNTQLDGEARRLEYADSIREWADYRLARDLEAGGRYLAYTLLDLEKRGVLTSDERLTATRGEGELAERIETVRRICDDWYARMTDLSVDLAEPLPPWGKLRPYWDSFVDLCVRLELLAHKQLRQRPWSDEDEAFLEGYGVKLGGVMGYSYGSVIAPEDDAPRAAPVLWDPLNEVVRVVGTGRPRELWVLYPYRGQRVPCRGVVLSYYEFDAPSAPDDEEWKALLDSPDAPAEPAWLSDG